MIPVKERPNRQVLRFQLRLYDNVAEMSPIPIFPVRRFGLKCCLPGGNALQIYFCYLWVMYFSKRNDVHRKNFLAASTTWCAAGTLWCQSRRKVFLLLLGIPH